MLSRFWVSFLLAPALALAQEYRSTVSGVVTDQQGAAIPGVKVTLVESSTGARFEATSANNGQYTIPLIPPGVYELTAAIASFKRYQRQGITVSTNQRVQLDVAMELGDLTETVSVTAEAPIIQTGTASVGQVITTNQVENMPMNGRTPMALAQLAMGVTAGGGGNRIRPFDNSGPTDISMGGGQARQNEVLIDGSANTTRDRRIAYSPPVDAVSEVKVEAFQTDAAYGNAGGGTINVVMKGGTNDFHGTAYHFHQNENMAARPFFGDVPPIRRWNQWGLTASGPIYLPKVMDLRNKLLWYFGYEEIRNNEPEVLTSTVPTELMRQGNFSEVFEHPRCAGSAIETCRIYDPLTGVTEGNTVRRTAFPNNVIPANRLSPIARNYLQYYPLPNQPGIQDNYIANARRADTFMSYLGRMDWNASDRVKIFGNFRFNDRIEARSNRFDNIASGNFLSRTNWGAAFDSVYTVTPTLIANLRFNWTRFTEGSTRPSDGFDPTSIGFPAYIANNATRTVLPRIDLDQHQDIGDSGGNLTPFDTFQIFATGTKVAGAHTLKVGADIRELREASINYGNSVGNFRFASDWTRGPLYTSASGPVGQSFASFLLGYPTAGDYEINTYRQQYSRYYALFIQDDWRATSRLTLNLGLRYERETGTVERYNRAVSGFDPTAELAVTQTARERYAARPNALLPPDQFDPRGGLMFAGPDQRTMYDPNPWNFAPRFGFAWSPAMFGGKTVLRGGVGVFFITIGTQAIYQPGFSAQTQMAIDQSYLTPRLTLGDPFPIGFQSATGAAEGVNTFVGQSVTAANRDQDTAYNTRWNFNIQQELSSNLVLEVGYMGSRGENLWETRGGTTEFDIDENRVPAEYLSTSLLRDNATISRLQASVPNPFAGLLPGTSLNSTNIQLQQLLRPYPQFNGDSGVRLYGLNNGYSNYHALMTRLEKRYASGLQFTASYTWSKLMEATRRLNPAIPELEYRVGDEDRTHRFVFGGNYDLPFGRGRAILGGVNRWMNLLVGGWSMNGILTLQSGGPISFDGNNLIYYGGDLNAKGHEGGFDKYVFDPTVFERSPQLQLAQNIRYFPSRFNDVRGDWINNIDFSVIKGFQISERVNLQLRGEAFNLFNRPLFNSPTTDATNVNFGRSTSQVNLPRAIQVALRLRW